MRSLLLLMVVLIAEIGHTQNEKLIWSDEFNGKGVPDSTFWSYNTGKTGYGNNEIQNYTSLPENARQENGVLIIEAIKSGDEWTSARIHTKNKFEFTYGRVVFRAKLPAGSGTWPALWLLGSNFNDVGWPACGEIDVMEHVGRNPGMVLSTIHTPSSYGNTIDTKSIPLPDFDKAFHVYEANWTSEKIEFSIDGNQFYTYNPGEKNNATWPFNNPFFIIINVAMGGNFGSDARLETNGIRNGIDPALKSLRMEVDYVRVYQNSNN